MDRRVVYLKEKFSKDLRHQWKIEEMAKLVNVTVSHLQKVVKDELDISPLQFLRYLRLEKARHLLETTFKNGKEIRIEVGIGDSSHFVKYFKERYGVTPSEYRRQHWAKIENEKDNASK